MKVSVIGATGFVGSHIVKELLTRGHNVTAIVRDASKLEVQDNLVLEVADVNDEAKLSAKLSGSDAIISAYNAGWTNPNLYNDFLNGSKSIEKAVEDSGVKRFIVVGGAGSLYTPDGTQIVDSEGFPEEIKAGALAARDYLNIIKDNKNLDWTYFSPSPEMHQGTSGVRVGTYRTSLETPVVADNGRSIISVEDVAVALVDELEQNIHIQQRFTAGY